MIAYRHYVDPTDQAFREAAQEDVWASDSGVEMNDWIQSPSVGDCVRVSVRTELQAVEICSDQPENFPTFLDFACRNSLWHKDLTDGEGFEPIGVTSEIIKTYDKIRKTSGTKCGTNQSDPPSRIPETRLLSNPQAPSTHPLGSLPSGLPEDSSDSPASGPPANSIASPPPDSRPPGDSLTTPATDPAGSPPALPPEIASVLASLSEDQKRALLAWLQGKVDRPLR